MCGSAPGILSDAVSGQDCEMNKYSGLVITLNEEKNIAGCISSLQKVCDDVVIVDSLSSDRTCEIAARMGAKVVPQNFLGDGPQRSFGLKHCKFDWVVNIDADEKLDDDLIYELANLKLDPENVEAYECRRKNHFHGRWIKVAGQYPDFVCRIFNKAKTDFSQVKLHTRIESKRLSRLSGHIIHNSFEDLSDALNRLNLYSDWLSEDLYNKGVKVPAHAPFSHGLVAFIKFYFLKRGFMAGLDGLTISIVKALGSYYKYAKLIEKHEQEPVNEEKSEKKNGSVCAS